MGNQSAIIVPAPEVEPVVSQWRKEYDKAASLGVPAHITLLYPFRPASVVMHEVSPLAEVFGMIQVFEFCFTEVRRFPKTAYLYPDRAEQFVEIVRALVKRWPDCEPYGGTHAEVIPHLTVADQVDSDILDKVESALQPQLPIACAAREAWLLCSDEVGFWSKKASFPLSSASANNARIASQEQRNIR